MLIEIFAEVVYTINVFGIYRQSEVNMSAMKETTLFMNGRSQSLRIPHEMRLHGEKAKIQKIGNILIVTESDYENPFLALDLAKSLVSDDFVKSGRELRPIQKRKGIEE